MKGSEMGKTGKERKHTCDLALDGKMKKSEICRPEMSAPQALGN